MKGVTKIMDLNNDYNNKASLRVRRTREFNNFINKLYMLKYYFDNGGEEIPYSKDYFEKHLFFITMHFKSGIYSAKNSSSIYNSKPLFDGFKLWFLMLVENALGKRAGQSIKHQPLTMAYLDVEGTAWGNAAEVFQTPHLHAVMLLHPKKRDEFASYLESDEALKFRETFVSKIDVIPFTDDGRGIAPVLTYAAKYARNQMANQRFDWLFEAYPSVSEFSYPFYKKLKTLSNGLSETL
ncbi:hypothetical protein QEZ48_14830 [Aquamicrobium lusatiense]|uniref:hypothetical protein n=1 Tax=Aquamicrobium lusatiense TaxID=89772 RepID=UPI002457B53B|nr:hypothetical protein [Aquamicrobium lusatiense]MDH4992092.1 hypothetical protein [Aquamicrobium lusatiense]